AAEKWSSAYGVGSQATGQSATAIGGQMVVINGDTWEEEIWSTTASGQESTAIGTAARATQYGSTAVGVVSEASGESATALGQAATARGDWSVAVGGAARAYGVFSTALGNQAQARGDRTIAMGGMSVAEGTESLAFGGLAATGGVQGVALGWNSIVFPGADGSMALGANSEVAPGVTNAVALGAGSYADRPNSISVGSPARTHDGQLPVDIEAIDRQITHVAAGTEDTNAGNVAQLQEVAKTAADNAYFFKASADPDSDSVGAWVEGDNAIAAGEASNAIGAGASALGGGANAVADNATALGFNALAAGDSSTAAGGELHYTYYDAELMEEVTIEGTTAATGIGASAF